MFLSIFPDSIIEYLYAVMIIIGAVGAGLYILIRLLKMRLPIVKLIKLIAICAISGGLMYPGAMLLDAIFHSIKVGHWTWWGISFYGGLIAAVVSFTILYLFIFRMDKKEFFTFLNIAITGVVLAHAFGRIGCYYGGCCYGKLTDAWYGVILPQYPGLGKRIPTMLFESGFLFILFIALLFVKKDHFIIYCISYGTFRFINEFLRGDDRGSTGFSLSPAQFISVLLIILGITLLIIQIIKRKKAQDEPIIE